MSTIDDLIQSLQSIIQEIEAEGVNLAGAKSSIQEKAADIDAEISSSTTGKDVAEALAGAVAALEDAEVKLEEAGTAAQDYADKLQTS